MTDGSKRTFAERLLLALASAIWNHRTWFVWPQAALFAASVWGTIQFLKFDMDRNSLVGAEKRYHQNFLKFKAEFPNQDDLVAVVESDDTEKNRQFVERLGRRLEFHSTLTHPTNLLAHVFYKGDLNMMGHKALLFVPEKSLEDLHRTLEEMRPFVTQFASVSNLESLVASINRQFRSAKRESSSTNDSLLQALPALQRIFQRATESLHRPGAPPSPGIDALFGAGPEAERQKYVTFANGRIYIATAKAREESLHPEAVDLFRKLVRETQREVPGVNVGVTGEPVLEYDEMAQSQKDSTIATLLSLAIVILIFVFGFQETGRPLKATVCLIVGLGYTMGYTTLVIGHLNILTITFVPMLIGLAIDFGVHLISRFEEELRRGRSPRHALELSVVNTGKGIFTGCLTTAGAFFAMALTDFKGIYEMGIITGGGMVICLFPMLTLLPALLLGKSTQNRLDHQRAMEQNTLASMVDFDSENENTQFRTRLEKSWLDRPWLILGITAALCAACLARFREIRFDYNLLNMQSAGLPAVVFEKKLIASSEKSVLYGAMIANDPQHALELQEKAQKLPSVAGADSMCAFLSEDSSRKRQIISKIKQTAASIHIVPPDPNPADIHGIGSRLWSLEGMLGLALDEVAKEKDAQLHSTLLAVRESAQSLRVALLQGDRPENARRIGGFQRALLTDLQDTFRTLATQDDSSGLTTSDLPPPLRHRFVGVTGKHLVQIYPKRDVWQRDAQEEFIRDLRTVDENVTGTPVQLYEYTQLLVSSYLEAAGWAFLAITLLALLHFRSVVTTLLALLPVILGAIWMVGFMLWTNIPFNPANIMTLPLVAGIGVTNGIHILNRYAEEKSPLILARSTGKAVIVSGLTTIAGFGSLIIADHQGIRSLGWVMAVGTATCMVAGLTFLPAVLILRQRRSTP